MELKRAAALYRVSTKKQVDVVKDDIPMQRIACRKFAEDHGWTIVIEKEEKGISGFKVSASDRDAIQELRESAKNGEFDVLLVFMFDRLGRIENETPFILEWFTNQGIEVWSVNEGQQKMSSHSDKLINYIRFWEASEESQKTSKRVRTRLEQMTTDGLYTGGVVPFGYMLVDRGRLNKKGKPVRDLEINPGEAEMVRELFSKTLNEGYGSHQLATYLNKKGFKTRRGEKFRSGGVLRILKNEMCRGYIVRGNVKSDRISDLQIVSDDVFFRVQDILKQRSGLYEEKRAVSRNNRGRELVSGNLFCAHCGGRIVGSRHIDKHTKVDGTVTKREYGIYTCYHRSKKLNACDGATTYVAKKVDEIVIEMLRYIFSNISGCPEEDKIKEAYKKSIELNRREQRELKNCLAKDEKKLKALTDEIGNSLLGNSAYSSDDLSAAITALKEQIAAEEEKLEQLAAEATDTRLVSESIIPAYRQFRTWSSEFDEASFEEKKMIVSQIFNRIELGRGYKIRFEINTTYKQFCEDWLGEASE